MDIEERVIKHFKGFLAVCSEENTSRRYDPLRLTLLLLGRGPLEQEACSIDHLAPCIHSYSKAPDLELSNIDNVYGRIGSDNIHHPEPLHLVMQFLDPVLQLGESLPCLTSWSRCRCSRSRLPYVYVAFPPRSLLLRAILSILPLLVSRSVGRLGSFCGLELLDIDSDDQFVEHEAQPCGLGKGRTVDGEPQPSYLDSTPIARGVGESSQGEVANSLNGNAGDDSKKGKQDKGREVEKDDNSKDEGRVKQGHGREAGGGQNQLLNYHQASESANAKGNMGKAFLTIVFRSDFS